MFLTTDQISLMNVLREFATQELGDSQAIIEIEETGDTVRALVASRKFVGMEYAERQQRLWTYLLVRRRSVALPPIAYVKTVEA